MGAADNFHGFISNAWDTKIMSSYVDENYSNGLKQNSKLWLGYDQMTYDEVTTFTGNSDDLPRGGRLLKRNDEDGTVTKQYRMNELTAEHVLHYGADDTICTSALFNLYGLIMDLEGTMGAFKQVEIKPAYMTANGYCDGTKVSIARLKKMEKDDDETYAKAETVLSKLLLEKGHLDKMWEPYTEWSLTIVKDACEELFGFRPETRARTPSKIAASIKIESAWGDESPVLNEFCAAVERSDLNFINRMLLARFKSQPVIDTESPKKMQQFLYKVLGLKVQVVNKLTPKEWEDRELSAAMRKYSKAQMKGEQPVLTPQEWELVQKKASGDSTAIDFALAFDDGIDADTITILKSIQTMKKIATLRKLYYTPYPLLVHWKDGLIHSSMNQCAAVTRRYSSSGPNLQQLPKKGEGIKVRSILIPHHKDAVIVSLDFSGQELRLAADRSKDPNMLSCYIGDNLKDIHSITAAGAMKKKWGVEKVREMTSLVGMENMVGTQDFEYTLFIKLREWDDEAVKKLADDLRKVAKNVNFGAQYDAGALTLALTIVIPVSDAQDFLDAREKMFPKVEVWKDSVKARVERTGYALTLLGARRHLTRLLQDPRTKNKAGRQGPNFEIQGSSAEQTKLAMARVWDSNVMFDYDCKFIAPVHDELVFSIHKDHVIDAVRIIHRCMTEQYADMVVPCLSSISLGPNFGEQIECGDYFIEPNIRKALDKVFGKAKELEAA